MAKLIKKDSQRAKNIPDASIPPGTVFTGDISTAGGIRIDGAVKGKVSAGGDITVGIDGVIEGNAKACHVNIAGKIIGNVTAAGAVQMLSGSKLAGDLAAASFAIEQGAYYKGQCTITDGTEQPMLTASKESEPDEGKNGTVESKAAEPEKTQSIADEAEAAETEDGQEACNADNDQQEHKNASKTPNRRKKYQKQ